MLLLETKLPFASTCRSGRRDLIVISYIADEGATVPRPSLTRMLKWAPELASVPTHYRIIRVMAYPLKIREISGNLPSSSGNFRNQQNPGKFSGNFGYGRFKCCFWECYVVFHMFCPSFHNHWKNKPFITSPWVNVCNIYLPMLNWWMASIYPNNGVHFRFMNILILCYRPKINSCHWCVLYVL